MLHIDVIAFPQTESEWTSKVGQPRAAISQKRGAVPTDVHWSPTLSPTTWSIPKEIGHAPHVAIFALASKARPPTVTYSSVSRHCVDSVPAKARMPSSPQRLGRCTKFRVMFTD